MGCRSSCIPCGRVNEGLCIIEDASRPNLQTLTVLSEFGNEPNVFMREEQIVDQDLSLRGSNNSQHNTATTESLTGGFGVDQDLSLRGSNNSQHSTATTKSLTSGYGGSEVSRHSSHNSGNACGMNNSAVDMTRQRLSSIPSCSTENCRRSSVAASIDIKVQHVVKENILQETIRHNSEPKPNHQECLIRKFCYIKDELADTASVMDHLINKGDMDDDDHDEVRAQGSRRKQVDLLLQKLMRSTSVAVDHFVEALKEMGRQDMVNVLFDDNVKITDLVPLDQNDRQGKEAILRDKNDFLVRELMPDSILDYFFQNGTFSLDDYETVSVKKTRKSKAKKLTGLIKKRLPWAYYDLLYALQQTQTFHIIEELVLSYQADGRLSPLPNICSGTASGRVMMDKCPIDNSEIQIEVHLSTKTGQRLSELERRINDHLNDSEGDDVRELLLEHAKYGFVESIMGSIIIRLRPYSTTSTNTLREFCKRGCIRKLIMKILKAKGLLSHLPEGEIIIDLKVERVDPDEKKLEWPQENVEQTEMHETDAVEMVRRNRSYLLEELDIYPVVKESLDMKILTDSEMQNIKECIGKGRRKATEMFIDCLIQQGLLGCKRFLGVLKRTQQTTILQHLQGTDAYRGQICSVKDNLVDHFQTVADEIDPKDFKEIFLERDILSRQYFHKLSERFSRNRRSRAIYFIKTILDHGADALKAFVDGLVQKGHTQLANMICDTMLKTRSNHTVEECDLEADFEIEEVMVEEVKSTGAVFSGRVEVIVSGATSLEEQGMQQIDLGSSDEISSNEIVNDDDEGLEVSTELSDHHHNKMLNERCKRVTRSKTLPAQSCERGSRTASSRPAQKVKKASSFPKHRKDNAIDLEDKSPLTQADSGYIGSQSLKQKLAQPL